MTHPRTPRKASVDAVVDVLAVVAITVYLILRIEGWLARRADQQAAVLIAIHKAQEAKRAATPPAETALALEGARALAPNQHGRLARFGLRPDRARELLVFTSERPVDAWPSAVIRALKRLHDAGRVRGPGVPDVLFRNGRLPPGCGVYFALLDAEAGAPPNVVAFVDDVR
jgi:hypothetical protein